MVGQQPRITSHHTEVRPTTPDYIAPAHTLLTHPSHHSHLIFTSVPSLLQHFDPLCVCASDPLLSPLLYLLLCLLLCLPKCPWPSRCCPALLVQPGHSAANAPLSRCPAVPLSYCSAVPLPRCSAAPSDAAAISHCCRRSPLHSIAATVSRHCSQSLTLGDGCNQPHSQRSEVEASRTLKVCYRPPAELKSYRPL